MNSLIRLCTTLANFRVLRVASFGAVGVIVQTLVFETLAFWLMVLTPSLATLVGAEMGVLTSFTLNNRYSFNDRSHAPLWHRLLRFHLVVSGSLFIQWLCVFSTELVTQDFYAIHAAYAAGILLGFISNYIGYHTWVWRHHSPPEA